MADASQATMIRVTVRVGAKRFRHVYQLLSRSKDREIGIFGEQSQLDFEALRVGEVVSVLYGDKLTKCLAEPDVKGLAPSDPSWPYQPNSRIIERCNDFCRPIRRAVVNGDAFPVPPTLLEKTFHGLAHEALCIVAGHYETDLRHPTSPASTIPA